MERETLKFRGTRGFLEVLEVDERAALRAVRVGLEVEGL